MLKTLFSKKNTFVIGVYRYGAYREVTIQAKNRREALHLVMMANNVSKNDVSIVAYK